MFETSIVVLTVVWVVKGFTVICLPFQVEDMRLIIHSLGKFLSHRDVKVMTYFLLSFLGTVVRFILIFLSTFNFFLLSLAINCFLYQELVQSALLESNTGRDDRILYNKLVRMSNM